MTALRILAFAAVSCVALPALAELTPVTVPSGQPVSYVDMVWGQPGPTGLTARFRFVAPDIRREAPGMTFDQAEPDMLFLCESFALPRLAVTGPRPAQIVISLSDRLVEFGQPNPDATQFFEAYRPEGTTCIWEEF